MITISYKGGRWDADLIKSASLSTGYRVYLFRRFMKGVKPFISGEYVVAVKAPDDSTAHWDTTNILRTACECFSGYLCCYA